MKVLLDTQAFLWAITGDGRLGLNARHAFLNMENRLFLSAASLWEICIKKSLGKISLKKGWLEAIRLEMAANTIQWLPIEWPHCREVAKLPFHHRDPFDRMLVAQARVEKLSLVSGDAQLSAYGIKRVW